jgi:hypothetical protein
MIKRIRVTEEDLCHDEKCVEIYYGGKWRFLYAGTPADCKSMKIMLTKFLAEVEESVLELDVND